MIAQKLSRASQRQIENFIQIAERCLEKEHGDINSTVLKAFGGNDGVEVMKNLFGAPKKLALKATEGQAQVRKVRNVDFNVCF